jgi:acetyl esterase/lipase
MTLRRIFMFVATALSVSSGFTVPSPAVAKEKYTVDPVTGKPEPEMKDLLVALTELGEKPIQTLTPAYARVQPTMQDAAVAVLKKITGSTDSSKSLSDVTTVEATILGSDENVVSNRLHAHWSGPVLGIVYFHGGGWVLGTPQRTISVHALWRKVRYSGGITATTRRRKHARHNCRL